MDLFAEVKGRVLAAVARLVSEGRLPEGLDLAGVTVEPPRDPAHGDMATNAAMVLARPARMAPRDIAEALAARARPDARASSRPRSRGRASSTSASTPGALVRDRARGARRGHGLRPLRRSARGARSTSSSSRRTRPGRCTSATSRGAVFGDALAGLLGFAGYEVTREYYINDGGAQVDVLARSAYERYREACGLEPAIAEGLYPGRLPDPGRGGAEGEVRRQPARQGRGGLARRGARLRHRGDDGDDPRRSRAARRRDGRLLQREVALRHRPDRGGARDARGRRA